MTKKLILGLAAVAVVVGGVAAMSAFEAHIINVTAKIENALSVTPDPIDFGTVFPQEYLEKTLTVSLSESFLAEGRVDDVDYFIKQKPKPIDPADAEWCHDNLPESDYDSQDTAWQDYLAKCYYPLCEYLSKHPDDDVANDGSLDAFHCIGESVNGRLAKSEGDEVDNWTIDLDVPCFEGMCAQDWTHEGWELPAELESQVFGCDLWIEVNGISEQPEREITTTVETGWGCDCAEEWQADGRWGDGGTTGAEHEIRIGYPGGGSPIVEAHTDSGSGGLWQNGQTEDFTLVYDGATQKVYWTIGTDSINTESVADLLTSGGNLCITGKTNGPDGDDGIVTVSEVKLDGISPTGPDGFVAQGVDPSTRGLTTMIISGDTQLSDGFTLTGKVKFDWGASPNREGPSLLIRVQDTD